MTADPSPTELPKRDLRFNEGVSTGFEIARGISCNVILDDPLIDVYSKHVCDLFTKDSYHRNISVNLITQFFSVVSLFLGHFSKREISGRIEERHG